MFAHKPPSLGVPYHSWRITHAKHHASTAHMTQDQVFVPKTRSGLGLPPLDPAKEDPMGRSVSDEVKQELWEALGDSPIGATLNSMGILVCVICTWNRYSCTHTFWTALRMAFILDQECKWTAQIPSFHQPYVDRFDGG